MLYERWTLTSGSLWISVEGDGVRHDLVEHLHHHPELLLPDPLWRDRLIEVTAARATQVLLPAGHDLPAPLGTTTDWQLTDEVVDLLLGRATIRDAEVPASLNQVFVTAFTMQQHLFDLCTYENTPLGVMNPERGMDEFPESDTSIAAHNDLLALLHDNPELAGTREFAHWYRPEGGRPLRYWP